MSLAFDFQILLFALFLIFDYHILTERKIIFCSFETLGCDSHLVLVNLSETLEIHWRLFSFVVKAVTGIVVLCRLRDWPTCEEEVLMVSDLHLLLVHRANLCRILQLFTHRLRLNLLL